MGIKAVTQSIWLCRWDECFFGLFLLALGFVAVLHVYQRTALSCAQLGNGKWKFLEGFLKFCLLYKFNQTVLIFLNSLLQFAFVSFCLETSCRELQLPASDFQILSLHILKSVNVILESCSLWTPSEVLWGPSKRNSLPWPLLSYSVLILQSSKKTQELWYLVRTQRKVLHLFQVFGAPSSHYYLS